MNNFIAGLEKKFRKYAIPNLALYMIICYAIGYIMERINPSIFFALTLNPYAILHGQVWRIFSWLLIPPSSDNLFFTLIMLYFYYSIGMSLERVWGTFYFNYYIFSGILFVLIAAFLHYGYTCFFVTPEQIESTELLYRYAMGECTTMMGGSWYYAANSAYFSTYYVSMSIFLAYAATFPEAYVYLFFVLPIKVKALGIIYAIVLVYEAYGMGWMGIFVLGASMLNFIIFFLTVRKNLHGFYSYSNPRKKSRFGGGQQKKQEPEKPKMRPEQSIAKHKCAVCGQTSEMRPDLQFRFCSKCEGNYEYCQEHLFTHTHVKRDNQ